MEVFVLLKGIQDGNWEVLAVFKTKPAAEEAESLVELENSWEFTDIQESELWIKSV